MCSTTTTTTAEFCGFCFVFFKSSMTDGPFRLYTLRYTYIQEPVSIPLKTCIYSFLVVEHFSYPRVAHRFPPHQDSRWVFYVVERTHNSPTTFIPKALAVVTHSLRLLLSFLFFFFPVHFLSELLLDLIFFKFVSRTNEREHFFFFFFDRASFILSH